ncbi:MAG: tRNA (5-methylaminomethyl-2-thiouridine)(34)-methyltransferase MnmD [Candidatus Nanoarchaeia archaeon]
MTLQPILTDDGSPTFRSEIYDEPYHSKSGAVEESFKKYALPLKIWEKENPIIYDVCSGMGYNAAAAIDVFLEKAKEGNSITIYCYENDELIINKTLEVNPEFKNYSIVRELVSEYFKSGKTVIEKEKQGKKIKLILRIGDAREIIKVEKEKADFVFFDPFSPKKHPEMWVEEFFKDVYEKMNNEGILSTYSYARSVRDNLQTVGFIVTAGPIVGRRSPSTMAFKK